MPIMLGVIIRIGRRSDAPNMGVHFVAISNSKYYIYAAKPSWISIPGYYLKICIWISGSSGPLE